MASIKLTGDTSGEIIIESPAVAGTNTLTLPASTGTILDTTSTLDATKLSGDLPAISGANLTGLPAPDELSTATGSAPSYSARAWVNFNGTGTVAIRASGNVSSITDNGTGDYTINFTTAMPDANYAMAGTTILTSGLIGILTENLVNVVRTTTAYRIATLNTVSSNYTDMSTVQLAILR